LILYVDTSALVKLYVREPGSAAVRTQARRAGALATSVVAYAEARAAFARLKRSGLTRDARHRQRLHRLDRDWEALMRVELTPDVLRSAGDLAEIYGLRGFDSIHLASALWLSARAPETVEFAVFDARLGAAASRAGLRLATSSRVS
jgi:predicted nucleic acid-binding protein